MAKFIFITTETDNREASKIQFNVPEDLDIWEFKRVCMRMAGAMGYTSISIKKAFGKEENPFNKEQEWENFTNVFLKASVSGSLV